LLFPKLSINLIDNKGHTLLRNRESELTNTALFVTVNAN
jgi:hypothetical protein